MKRPWIHVGKDVTLDKLVNTLWVTDENAEEIGIFVDLCKTIGDSPAEKIVREYGKKNLWRDGWVLHNFFKRKFYGKSVDSEIWRDFLDTRLSVDPRISDFIRTHYNPQTVVGHIYKNCVEFISSFPEKTTKVIVSRIDGLVGEAYKEALGFNKILFEQFDKAKAACEYLRNHPYIQKAIVIGDSKEDRLMGEEAKRELGSERVIVIGVSGLPYFVVKSSSSLLMPGFDIHIGRHYGGLIALRRDVRNFVLNPEDRSARDILKSYIGETRSVT